MTETQTEQAAEPRTEHVVAQTGTRLEQLQASYADAKAAADAAAERLKNITDGIKAELATVMSDGVQKVELVGGVGPAMRLTYAESWRVDSRKLKAEDPETYVRYAKKTGSWTLRALGGVE